MKYNMTRVKQHLELQYAKDPEGLKFALSSYNSDGYKQISVIAFDESALPAKTIVSGTLIALMNPRMMPANTKSASEKAQQGLTLCITSIEAIVQIGLSKDFNICVRESVHPVTQKPIPCHRFVNKSVEKICESHRSEL